MFWGHRPGVLMRAPKEDSDSILPVGGLCRVFSAVAQQGTSKIEVASLFTDEKVQSTACQTE